MPRNGFSLAQSGKECVPGFVQLQDVSLRYNDEETALALHHTSFEVEQGEFVAVVGPSGCGKSTLMKVVTGLWPATAGHVSVANVPVGGPLNCVGMAFQNSSLLPWRTILQNVMLPLEIVEPHASRLRRERSRYEAKARDLIALVGLKGYEDKQPWQLSGGMQQRTQLCRALIHEPSLLMLDEPFGALDMFTREELWLALQELWMARRPTVILVTHDLREAVFLADRVLVMSARPGRIILDREVKSSRPRALNTTYESDSVNLVHELREHISAARANAA
jgi:NitT/TauT family transport system ATP-binding protein